MLEFPTMAAPEPGRKAARQFEHRAFPLLLVALGFLARVGLATITYLNPDEALHYWLSVQPSLRLAYQATLTSAHPPLFILMLYFWHGLGHSELLLRMPSVLAGTGFCWFGFKWLERVVPYRAALLTLILLLFSPSLIALAAEVRQYALMLFFMAASLYFFELALAKHSWRFMLLFGAALLLSLLSHYSALFFALAMAIYALLRLYPRRTETRLVGIWLVTQVLALGLCIFVFIPHLVLLRQQGLPQQIADTWLRKSIFHPAEESFLIFVGRQTVRLFRYLVGQPAGGGIAMLFFLYGLFSLFRPGGQKTPGPNRLELSLVLLTPLIATIVTSRIYPYGGTRHDSFLALAVFTVIGSGINALRPRQGGTDITVLVALMAVSNLHPSPGGPYIRPQDQRKQLMHQAVAVLDRSASPAGFVFTDYQGGLVLGYYACQRNLVTLWPSVEPFRKCPCGRYQAITTSTQIWSLSADQFASQVAQLATRYGLGAGSEVWFFRSGWGVASDRVWSATLSRFGCDAPGSFGASIFLCRLKLVDRV